MINHLAHSPILKSKISQLSAPMIMLYAREIAVLILICIKPGKLFLINLPHGGHTTDKLIYLVDKAGEEGDQ